MLFLRDLKDSVRELTEREIRESNREDLKKALEEGEDIQIGEYYRLKNYKVAYS